MRGDAHREEERGERPYEPVGVKAGRERGPDRHVREVPCGVRRVEQRHVVAPAATLERVERGPYFLRPHVTIPPPNDSRFACTSSTPASRQACSRRGRGQSA